RSLVVPITGAKDGRGLSFKAANWPCEFGVEPIETTEMRFDQMPGEKRNDHPENRQCGARMRAAVAGCRGPWTRRRPTDRATSRAQRGDEQVLPMPHRRDVSRPATGSTRMGSRNLSHDRTRRVVDARRDQLNGRLPRQRIRAELQAGKCPIEIIAARRSRRLRGSKGANNARAG